MTTPPYTLEELEDLSGTSARTIRSWVQAEVLPEPRGRGPGAHYGDEHLDRILFIQKVQEDRGARRVPLALMRQIFESVPPEQVTRVARGEEELTIADLATPMLSSLASPSTKSARKFAKSAPKRSRPRQREGPWTTIEIAEGIELRMCSDEPDQVARLARLARRAREWLETS